jgi:hypothetical protein
MPYTLSRVSIFPWSRLSILLALQRHRVSRDVMLPADRPTDRRTVMDTGAMQHAGLRELYSMKASPLRTEQRLVAAAAAAAAA